MNICQKKTSSLFFGIAGVVLFASISGARICAQASSTPSAAELKLTPQEKKQLDSMKGLSPSMREEMAESLASPDFQKRGKYLDELHTIRNMKAADEAMDATAKFLRDHLDFVSDPRHAPDNGSYVAFILEPSIKSERDDGNHLQSKLSNVSDAFPESAALGKSEYEIALAHSLFDADVALDYAASLAADSIHLLTPELERELLMKRHIESQQYAAKHDKNFVPEPLNMATADKEFKHEMAKRYAILGRVEAKLNHNDAALQSYRKSLSLSPDMEAFLGASKLEELNGDKTAALQSLESAELTGTLSAEDILHLKELYAVLHPGSNEDALESELDEKYRVESPSPVTPAPYIANGKRSNRTVLAELITGAACEPCMAPDLAFDASLQRYKRDELTLLVYHGNAPIPDPLANRVGEERAAYYSTYGSTPHTFIDGDVVEGIDGSPSRAQKSLDAISKVIDGLLETPAVANLEIKAKGSRSKIKVFVQGTISKPMTPLQLHIDLVETEVSYSGENSLRFNPMVVRATAKLSTSTSGFTISGNTKVKIRYTFDLPKIEAENLAYSGRVVADMKKRNGIVGYKYREMKTAINPNKLAVVAFLQNDATKGVVQSAFTRVIDTADKNP